MSSSAEGATGPFSVGDSVYVPHTDKLYEAKVLKAARRPPAQDGSGGGGAGAGAAAGGASSNQWHYLVHYIGWNKKWDEWIEATGLTPAADAAALGLLPQQQAPPPAKKAKGAAAGAAAAMAAAGAAGVGGYGGVGGDGGAYGGGVLGGYGGGVAGGAVGGGAGGFGGAAGVGVGGGPILDLELTGRLKQQLLDDYDAVVTRGRLVPLPRGPSAAEVARRYLATLKAERAARTAANPPTSIATATSDQDIEDFAAGLSAYFDKSLPHFLLYPSERAQARAALSGGALPSSVYGAEHLLRLLVRLPELLPSAPALSQEHADLLRDRLDGFVAFVQANFDRLLLPPGEAYVGAAEGVAGAEAVGRR